VEPMSPLIAGDPIIDDRQPTQILIVGPGDVAGLVTAAASPVGQYLQVRTCNSLAEAADHLRAHSFDVIVLDPNLPDSWPADSYRRLSEETEAIPVLILTDAQDLGFLAQTMPPPFAVLGKRKGGPRHRPAAADQRSAAQEGVGPRPATCAQRERVLLRIGAKSSSHFIYRAVA
jgi:CheY-like chemotaxis protein